MGAALGFGVHPTSKAGFLAATELGIAPPDPREPVAAERDRVVDLP
jgi:hypothetical protein